MARTAVATKTPRSAVAAGYRNQSVSVSDGTQDQDYWWLQALQQGNDAGLQWLLDQYGTWIYSKAYRMLQSHEDAEEAWQDIFMRVWQKIDLWDPERGNFQSWLNPSNLEQCSADPLRILETNVLLIPHAFLSILNDV